MRGATSAHHWPMSWRRRSCNDSYRGIHSWQRDHETRTGIPEKVIHAFIALGDTARLNCFLDHVLAEHQRYPLHEVLIPAAKAIHPWAANDAAGKSALSRLAEHCLAELRTLTAKPIQPPADWSREADFKCSCPDCKMLAKFLLDPAAKVGRFPLRKDRRQHLHRQIDSCRCDCTHITDRKGSPQTLVCTKTQTSYERRLKQYGIDQQLLRELENLAATPESSVPSPHKRKRTASPTKRSRK
jgi:hypothetical protein